MRIRTSLLAFLILLLYSGVAYAQANGKLQIHFMDVGQGDGAVLISPGGEVVLFDDGVQNQCDKPVSYLQQLGVTKIDYHIASHYHADHIGCAADIFAKFPLKKDAIDRGGSYRSAIYQAYVSAIGGHRKTATPGMAITLDAGSADPTRIDIIALNGNGVTTTNENDLSVVAVVHFGQFDAEIGGDLSGFKTGDYEDIESTVKDKVGQVEVYKVHHHGSRYSSNDAWLSTIKPVICIVSTGAGNRYGHPTHQCLERLHKASAKTYWTEAGNGTPPGPGQDIVGGNIIVQVAPASQTFSVSYSVGRVDTYPVWEAPQPSAEVVLAYAWSEKSDVYHYANCRFVGNINLSNLHRSDHPPVGRRLHPGCPKQ